jgi:uncharacterized protein
MNESKISIGKITKLMRFPFKGMGGEHHKELSVTFSGVVGDRVWAFALENGEPRFPWFAGKKFGEMSLFHARFQNEIPNVKYPRQEFFEVEVTTPDGQKFNAQDPALLKIFEDRAREKIFLRFTEKGMQDARPVSLIGNATISGLADEVGAALDPLRFRMNFYIDWKDPKPFLEDDLLGKTIRIGETVTLKVISKNGRCPVINVDPQTGESNPEVLKKAGRNHQGNVGVYAAVIEPGIVRDGDDVFLLD